MRLLIVNTLPVVADENLAQEQQELHPIELNHLFFFNIILEWIM